MTQVDTGNVKTLTIHIGHDGQYREGGMKGRNGSNGDSGNDFPVRPQRSWNIEKDDPFRNVKDLKKAGRPGYWTVLAKATSEAEGWTKITKAHEIAGRGCIVEVTVENRAGLADTTFFIPNVRIQPDPEYVPGHDRGNRLVKMCLLERLWAEVRATAAWLIGR